MYEIANRLNEEGFRARYICRLSCVARPKFYPILNSLQSISGCRTWRGIGGLPCGTISAAQRRSRGYWSKRRRSRCPQVSVTA